MSGFKSSKRGLIPIDATTTGGDVNRWIIPSHRILLKFETKY